MSGSLSTGTGGGVALKGRTNAKRSEKRAGLVISTGLVISISKNIPNPFYLMSHNKRKPVSSQSLSRWIV